MVKITQGIIILGVQVSVGRSARRTVVGLINTELPKTEQSCGLREIPAECCVIWLTICPVVITATSTMSIDFNNLRDCMALARNVLFQR